MTGCSENKVPFDYNKHIIIKNILSTQYRAITEHHNTFQGIELDRCEKCFVRGYSSVGVPFVFQNLSTEEIKCHLHRMGVKFISLKELENMGPLHLTNVEDEEILLCETCLEDIEEFNS